MDSGIWYWVGEKELGIWNWELGEAERFHAKGAKVRGIRGKELFQTESFKNKEIELI